METNNNQTNKCNQTNLTTKIKKRYFSYKENIHLIDSYTNLKTSHSRLAQRL